MTPDIAALVARLRDAADALDMMDGMVQCVPKTLRAVQTITIAARASADALETLQQQATLARAAAIEEAAKVLPVLMQEEWSDICSDTDCHPLDIQHRGRTLFYSEAHWTAAIQRRLLALSPTVDLSAMVERGACAVHTAYLETARRLSWPINPKNDRPYDELSEDAKELDRATTRAVISEIIGKGER